MVLDRAVDEMYSSLRALGILARCAKEFWGDPTMIDIQLHDFQSYSIRECARNLSQFLDLKADLQLTLLSLSQWVASWSGRQRYAIATVEAGR